MENKKKNLLIIGGKEWVGVLGESTVYLDMRYIHHIFERKKSVVRGSMRASTYPPFSIMHVYIYLSHFATFIPTLIPFSFVPSYSLITFIL